MPLHSTVTPWSQCSARFGNVFASGTSQTTDVGSRCWHVAEEGASDSTTCSRRLFLFPIAPVATPRCPCLRCVKMTRVCALGGLKAFRYQRKHGHSSKSIDFRFALIFECTTDQIGSSEIPYSITIFTVFEIHIFGSSGLETKNDGECAPPAVRAGSASRGRHVATCALWRTRCMPVRI
jgi:hypothetical protein